MQGNILGNVSGFLFQIKIFYLCYVVSDMVKDHSSSKRDETCCCHYMGYSSSISSNRSFTCTIPQITHTITFVTPGIEHWLEQQIAQWIYHEGLIQPSIAPWLESLPQSYISIDCYMTSAMVNGHMGNERGNPLLPLHGLIFPTNYKGYFICTIPQQRSTCYGQLWSTGWNETWCNRSTR